MTIEKRSGHYRITKMVNGKRYRTTVNHKPTKMEAEEIIQELISASDTYSADDMTFEQAFESYLQAKSNVLSPSTRRGYHIVLKRLPEAFRQMQINDMDHIVIQKEINRQAATLKPKTVRNTFGVISAVLGMFRPQMDVNISLPQPEKPDLYLPESEEVKRVLEEVKDTKYYVPFVLGVCGMRRSEICAATPADLDGNILTISKAIVPDENNKDTEKGTKTTESTRSIYIPDEIVKRIHDTGVIYDGDDTSLWKKLNRTLDKLGIPHFRFHDLRAFYVSYAHMQGIPDQVIMEAGGWKTDYTMKKIYRRTMQDEYRKEQEKFWGNAGVNLL